VAKRPLAAARPSFDPPPTLGLTIPLVGFCLCVLFLIGVRRPRLFTEGGTPQLRGLAIFYVRKLLMPLSSSLLDMKPPPPR